MSFDELNSFRIKDGLLAYQEYQVACKIANRNEYSEKQIKLRGYMTLCLYDANRSLEAQLYALVAIWLLKMLKDQEIILNWNEVEKKLIEIILLEKLLN